MSESGFELVEGSGNVFRDLGDPDADLKQAKAVLAARIVAVLDERDLHARAAAKFVALAGSFDAEVRVTHHDTAVPGVSIMGLLLLGAGKGCEIEVACEGAKAAEALAALQALVAVGFPRSSAGFRGSPDLRYAGIGVLGGGSGRCFERCGSLLSARPACWCWQVAGRARESG